MTTKTQNNAGQNNRSNVIGIITMIFLFGMISFVTNLAAPVGIIWKNLITDTDGGSTTLGMMGNMMNFLAYLFMGIPAGKMLMKFGYKKTALTAIAVGLLGIFVQFLSGKMGNTGFYVYLSGAFIAGLSVCLLNTVVNPMLNLLGGGGNRGNQLIQVGGSFNSLVGTATPILVGAMIGDATRASFSDVNLVLYIAMAVFVATFVILLFVPFSNPTKTTVDTKYESSPWKFRHFTLGAITIFTYVGIEVGIPSTLIFYLSDITTAAGAGLPAATAVGTATSIASTYWFLMLVGRLLGSLIAGKVSSKSMLSFASGVGAILVLAAILLPKTMLVSMPAFTGSSFTITQVPISVLFLVLCGLCTSIMWGSIFNLATAGLGKYTPLASGIFMMMVVGGGIIPLVQGWIADMSDYMTSYWLIFACLIYMLYYGVMGSKNVNTNIKVN